MENALEYDRETEFCMVVCRDHGFPKLGVNCSGFPIRVPIKSIVVWWGLYGPPLFRESTTHPLCIPRYPLFAPFIFLCNPLP